MSGPFFLLFQGRILAKEDSVLACLLACFGKCRKWYTNYGRYNIEASSRCSKQSLTIVFTPGNCCHFQFGSSSSSLSIRVSFIFHLSHCPDFQVTSPCVILIYQAIYTDITPNGLYCYIALLMGWKTPIYRWLTQSKKQRAAKCMKCMYFIWTLTTNDIKNKTVDYLEWGIKSLITSHILCVSLLCYPLIWMLMMLASRRAASWERGAASGFGSDYCYMML